MPKDFYVDQQAGDIYPGRLVEGAEFTQQSLWLRLSLWLGDWFLDNRKGIDWELALSHQPPRLAELFDQIRKTAMGTHGITGITRFEPQIIGRKLTLYLSCSTIYGTDATYSGSFGE